jgi:hypothetical protein
MFQDVVRSYQAIFGDELAVWRATDNGFGDFVQRIVP